MKGFPVIALEPITKITDVYASLSPNTHNEECPYFLPIQLITKENDNNERCE